MVMLERNYEQSSSGTAGSIDKIGKVGNESLEHHQKLTLGHQSERANPLWGFLNALKRKKPLDCRTSTPLDRCLNLLDLTALGVGSTLGLGLYVLAGQVASSKAGPAVVISFALAAIASAFSAVCYAEFAGLVPRAGSAYTYSYITMGEFVAFILGWNLLLEYVIGAASVARGFSSYIRFVFNQSFQIVWQYFFGNIFHTQTIKAPRVPAIISTATSAVSTILGTPGKAVVTTASIAAANITETVQTLANSLNAVGPHLADSIYSNFFTYFDWISVAIIAAVTLFILRGVRGSTNVTFAFTGLNLLVVGTVVISSFSHLNLHNWQLSKSEIPRGFGEGGFLPYGWSGMLAGSATCFFGFIGFDTIASSAEEAKNPKRNVPLSILLSLFISFLAYMSVAIVQTLIWPYYDQNRVVILPYIFDKLHMSLAYWTVLLGAVAGLASSQLAGMYPLPRIVCSMAKDKLIFSPLAHIHRTLKIPIRATIVSSIAVAFLACIFDIESLADMVSIGTLTAYSLVSLSVLILRYEQRNDILTDSNIQTNHLNFINILNDSHENYTNHHSNEELKFQNLKNQDNLLKKQQSILSDETPSSKHPKLTSKPSTPIREKGSKPLTPQLSVGFQSWFKSENEQLSATGQELSFPKSHKQDIFSIISTWKTDNKKQPDEYSSDLSKVLIFLIVAFSIILDITFMLLIKLYSNNTHNQSTNYLTSYKTLIVTIASFSGLMLIAIMLMLSRLPTRQANSPSDNFQVPLVPLIPTISIIVNTFLMLNLSILTWYRFIIWMIIGLVIYFTYGIWKSEGYLLNSNS